MHYFWTSSSFSSTFGQPLFPHPLSKVQLPLPIQFQPDIQKLVAILAKYPIRRVILYGSVARGDQRPDSDLDICVDGLSGEHFFRALGECLLTIDRP